MVRLYTLLLGLLWLLPHGASAQTTDSLRDALDFLFAPLDKGQVPSPYLVEYGNRFASPTPHNGTLTDSSVTSLLKWRLLYASLVSGNVGRPSSLPALPDVNTTIATQVANTPGSIPLVVQYLSYATLRWPWAQGAGDVLLRVDR